MNHSAGTFPSVIAVLPAAGIGSRMQAECPKQYLTIGRHSIVEHAIHALLRHPRIERVIVAIGPAPDRDGAAICEEAGVPYAIVGDANKPGDFLTCLRDAWMVALSVDRLGVRASTSLPLRSNGLAPFG